MLSSSNHVPSDTCIHIDIHIEKEPIFLKALSIFISNISTPLNVTFCFIYIFTEGVICLFWTQGLTM